MSTSKLLDKLKTELELEVANLPLVESKSDIVHGEGNVSAEVMLIGEAPGYHETVERRPFVGRSGQLLRKVLVEVGLPPEKVFISNIVKARPPENRDPTAEEITAFRPFLDREIEIINPKLMVTLGRFSMAKFLPDVFISQVHGRLHRVKWRGKWLFVLPMYHPAAGLRATKVKESFINDFKKVQKILKWIECKEEIEDRKLEVGEALF